MTEQQQQERDDQPHGARDTVREAMADALAREVVGLVALGVALLVLDPRVRLWVRTLIGRVRWQVRDAAKAAEEHAVAKLRRDISEFEHGSNTVPPKDGGCGCGNP